MIDKSIFEPFIKAVEQTIQSHTGEIPEHSEPGLVSPSIITERDYFLDISSIIALSGENIIGSCILSFFNLDAQKLTKKILEQEEVIVQEIYDTISELVNLVGGNLKKAWEGENFDYTTPYICAGTEKKIEVAPGFECYSITFKLGDITFFAKLSSFDDKLLSGNSVLNKINNDADSRKTVLIVDDSSLARKTIKKELGEEYNFLEAINGEEAVELAKRYLPDLITMDIEMPGLNGFYVCLTLRENPITHDIPIVIVTARRGAEDLEKGYYVGAIEFFSKPIVKNEIHDFVVELFESEKNTGKKNGVVLLIEDNHIERYNARYILKRFGFTVIEARDGKEAQKYFKRDDISCIVAQLKEPLNDSIEIIKSFKSNENFYYVPIITCSTYISRNALKKAFDAGAVDFIRKPFMIEEYLARVRSNVLLKNTFNEINDKKNELEEVIGVRDKYFHFIVHELRTPLNSILSFNKLKNENAIEQSEIKRIDNIINDELFNLMELINSILEISKIETEEIKIEPDKFCVNDVVDSAFAMLNVLSKVKSLKLNLLLDSNPYIVADMQKFKAILVNLISNAIKYTSDGSVTFEYSKENNYHVFKVIDTGIGIPQGYEDKIFKEYQRVTDKTEIRGTGIGLALVKKYVEAHGGEIKAESEGHGNGSVFTFTIPDNL